jgi:hypothetical protein
MMKMKKKNDKNMVFTIKNEIVAKKRGFWKKLVACGIISVLFSCEILSMTKRGDVTAQAVNEVEALDLSQLSKDGLTKEIWSRIVKTSAAIGNILAFKSNTGKWHLLESGVVGKNIIDLENEGLCSGSTDAPDVSTAMEVGDPVVANTWVEVVEQTCYQGEERTATKNALSLTYMAIDDSVLNQENLDTLVNFLETLEQWGKKVLPVVGTSCIDLIDSRAVNDECYVGSSIGAWNALKLIRSMQRLGKNINLGKAVLELIKVLDKGSLSKADATAAANRITELVPEVISCNDISIRWLRNCLHTEVQLLVMINEGKIQIAKNSLVLSLKDPCKSCVQTPILTILKNNNCYFTSANQDASSPHIERVGAGLIKTPNIQGCPKSPYISVTK